MTKKLYKIGHLTKKLGITSRTVRYYDQMGLLPDVKRSEGGIRLFDDEDLAIISKIKKLQIEQDYSLEKIKAHLFGGDSNQTFKVAIVTDSSIGTINNTHPKSLSQLEIKLKLGKRTIPVKTSTQELWEHMFKTNASPQWVLPTKKAIKQHYQHLKNEGYTYIIALHSKLLFPELCQNSKALSNELKSEIQVNVIDLPSCGPSLGLLSMQLAESLQAPCTKDQIRIFIEKNKPLAMDIISNPSLNYIYHLNRTQVEQLSTTQLFQNELSSVIPTFYTTQNGNLQLLRCDTDTDRLIETILEFYDQEVQSRGKYLYKIKISYMHLYKIASTIKTHLEAQHSHIDIECQEYPSIMAPLFGEKFVMVSLL